ncbi:MAG: type IV pilus assembly protein PilM [Armatimonadetes bacterium]|nr:type IV pilus assembly protein PilM [Armatimonadota bacterium]
MAVLGLDIGSDTIKVVELAKGRGGYQLLNYGIAPTPPDAVAAGDVQDPEMLGEAIRQLLASRRIKTKLVVSSVQGLQSLVVRIIELPRCEPKELADTMKFEVERHIPFPASQIIMDYAVLDRPGLSAETPNMEILFAAVQEESIIRHVEALKQAKLKPRAIDVQPLALGRALVECTSAGRGVGETVAVVNIGAGGTDLSIIRDGVLHFPRSIPIGGKSITQRLSEGLGVSEQQAERQKRQYGTMRVASRRPPPPAADETAEPVEEGPAFGGAIFEWDTQDDSDTGFGGSGFNAGTAPTTAGATPPDEDPGITFVTDEEEGGRDRFELDSDDSDADLLGGGGQRSHRLAPDEPDRNQPDEEPFSFGLDPETDSDDDAQPRFELPAEHEPTAGEGTFTFELPTDEGGTEDPTFDFTLGATEDSSVPVSSPGTDSGATDVGSSFDLGDLGSDDAVTDLGAGVLGGDTGTPTFDVADIEVSDVGLPAGVHPTTAPAFEVDENSARVHEVIEPVVREIAAEIGRSLEYYRSRYEGAVVDRVVLVGGTARIDGLADFFEAELGIPVDVGDPVAPLVVSSSARLSDEDLQRDAPLLAVAVGLALRELA